MIQLILKDVKCLRLNQTENVYAGENKISEFSVVLPEKITQYKTAECEIEMRSFVSEDRYISNIIDTSTRNPKVPITSDLTEKAQIVPIMFFITHEGNVIGKTNFEKLNVLESKDGSTPLDPREELDEIIAELRAENAAQAQTIASQATTIEQQSDRITELNSEVADLSANNELLRDTVETFNKSEPKLETPDIVTPRGETQLITPDTSEGYVGLKSVTVDRVSAEGINFHSEWYKEGEECVGQVGTYNPFPEHSYGGIYYTELGEGGYPKKILIKDMLRSTSTIPQFFNNSVNAKRELREVVFENCPEFLEISTIFVGFNYLTKVILPNSLTVISITAFQDCTSLMEIKIPDTLTSIGRQAFLYCTSLTEINLPNSLTSIAGNAFQMCTSLTNLTLAQGFNCNGLNVSSSTRFTAETIVACLEALADRTGQTAYTITFGTTNLNKLTAEQKAIATNKNWNLA